MFLKSITLKGFKSFAESTTLEFESGVTVVVGPNGSGKSNVVDAVAWVLGAQAPGSVRSQKMDDVIFAGTTKRSALGRAEVSLTIDNSAKILPLDFNEITISRTLFRDGESEYAMNNVSCRLLDIQELLSDSGVGRHQHVIVSQGQIDAVLNSKPEERRAIIEEAAGVLKYRKRREKSQRRLKATEENLTRLQDLLREVRRQLKPLERQADAARRHGSLFDELTTLRRHLAGKEIASLREGLKAIQGAKTQHHQSERGIRSSLTGLDSQIEKSEDQLATSGVDDAADHLAQAEGLRERAKGLRALLTERIASIHRQIDMQVDQGVVETLEAETARLRQELSDSIVIREELVPATKEIVKAEKELASQRSNFQTEFAPELQERGTAAAESRGQLAVINTTLENLQIKIVELSVQLQDLKESEKNCLTLTRELDLQLSKTSDSKDSAEKNHKILSGEAGKLLELLNGVQAKYAEAQLESKSWVARADALSLALEESRKLSGIEEVSEIEGVYGSLLELIHVDDGWEAAFEAAIGLGVASVVVNDIETAKKTIAKIQNSGRSGGVLIAPSDSPSKSPQSPLRDHVQSDLPEIEILLDKFLSGIRILPDWSAGVEQSLLYPETVFVTMEGDHFSPRGWRIGVSGKGATGSALEEALDRSQTALDNVRQCEDELRRSQRDLEQSKKDLDASTESMRQSQRDFDEIREAKSRSESDIRALRVEIDALEKQEISIQSNIEEQIVSQNRLVGELPDLETHEKEALERTKIAESRRQELETIAAEVGAKRAAIDVRLESMYEREKFLQGRLSEIENRLNGFTNQREEAESRRLNLEKRLRLAEFLRTVVEEKSSMLEIELLELRQLRQHQSDSAQKAVSELEGYRIQRSEAEIKLSQIREELHRSELKESEYSLKLEALVETVRRELDCEPGAAISTECPPIEGVTAKGRVRELERELKIMGPINPLALQEYEELNSRFEFLQAQLQDVRDSRRELNKVIKAIDQEIVTVFTAAFADISMNFENLFSSLFPGGEGSLKLTEPNNLLETGIEIEAKPSGKNIKKLSLLSGGERSLTSLAFLFSIFRSRPSPFYVMDEVEAALDDVNLQRFLQLVKEFRDEAQLIIVSHQKRTMETADCLYGVTMKPGGSSKIVSEKPSITDHDKKTLFEMADAQTNNV